MKIVINEENATRAKIVMARNVDVDDDLFHDLHAPRKLQLAVMVSFKEVLDIDDQNVGDNWHISRLNPGIFRIFELSK